MESRKRLKEMKLARQQRFAQKEKPASPRWWSDPPKLVPIILSVFALAISCLSLWISNRGRLINEEVNRPVLALTSVKIGVLHPPDKDEQERLLYLLIVVKLKNLGKSTAHIQGLSLTPQIWFGENGCEIIQPGSYNIQDLNFILPGMEGIFSYQIQLTKNCRTVEFWPTETFIAFDYLDKASGITYRQDFREMFTVQQKRLEYGLVEHLAVPEPTPPPYITPSPTSTPTITPTPTPSP